HAESCGNRRRLEEAWSARSASIRTAVAGAKHDSNCDFRSRYSTSLIGYPSLRSPRSSNVRKDNSSVRKCTEPSTKPKKAPLVCQLNVQSSPPFEVTSC